MNIEEIKEIKDVQRISVDPGCRSGVIKRNKNTFLIVVAVEGNGTIQQAGQDHGGYFVNYHTAPRLDFRDGDDFQLVVLEEMTKPLVAVVYKMTMSKYA